MTERGEQTRAKLEDAALSLFLETGWEATTGFAIRIRADVSQGSWTHAFPGGKLEIAAAIFEGLHIKLWDAVLAEMERGKHRTYDGAVTAGLTELVRQLRHDPERCHLLFTLAPVLLAESSGGHIRPVKQRVEVVEERLVQALRPYSKQIDCLYTLALSYFHFSSPRHWHCSRPVGATTIRPSSLRRCLSDVCFPLFQGLGRLRLVDPILMQTVIANSGCFKPLAWMITRRMVPGLPTEPGAPSTSDKQCALVHRKTKDRLLEVSAVVAATNEMKGSFAEVATSRQRLFIWLLGPDCDSSGLPRLSGRRHNSWRSAS